MGMLEEWIDDLYAVEFLAELHIFRQQDAAAGLPGHAEDEGIPIREAVQAMDVDGCEDVADRRLGDVEARIYLDFLSGKHRVKAEFPRSVHEVLLEHLEGNDT